MSSTQIRAVLIFMQGVSLTLPVLPYLFIYFLIWGVSLIHPMLTLCLCGEFLLHIPSWLYVSVGSFSYTSHAGFFYFNVGSSSYTSRAGFSFICGRFLKHPVLASILCGEFLLHIPWWLFLGGEFLLHIPCWYHIYLGSFSYTSRAGFVFFVLFFYVGSFCYTFRNYYFFKYFFNGVVSLTHPVLASFLSGEFLSHIPCGLHFYVGSFSYTSRAGFTF